jgi:PAS domain S-box-containing protein
MATPPSPAGPPDLRDSLQDAIERMPDGFCLIDRHWKFRYVNAAAEAVLQRPREALLGRGVWDEFPEALALGLRQEFQRAVDAGQATSVEVYYEPFDVWIEANAQPTGTGLAVYFRDITARKKRELSLRASEERLRVLSTTTSDVVWEWNLSDDSLSWNEGIETVLGYRREAIDPTIDFRRTSIHPDDASRVSVGLSRSLAGGDAAWADEYRFRRADGSYAHVYDRARILRNAEGEPLRVMGGLSDVSERKRAETQMLRAQRLESIGTLAGGMAHDLNNVLAPILLSLEVLREVSPDPMALGLIDTIQHSARRGADLVAQVLSFARGVEGERAPVPVIHLVDDVRRLLLETFPKSIVVRTDVDEEVWDVHGDRTQLHQVLMNLCVNARDAMPKGGVLAITAGNRVLDDLYVEQHPGTTPGPYVFIQVEDTGTGMTEAVRERLFEPFFTTKPAGMGSGLGLPTSLAIVNSHGGVMDVYTELDRGTAFKVYLPARTVSTRRPAPEPRAPLPRGHGELVLLVDDEEHVRTVARRTLEHYGYRVLTAANGAEAVALFASHIAESPVVLTDMTMPVMDGPSAIIAMRALDPDVRVIGSSGLGPDGEHARALGAALTHFVPKPYTAEHLLRTLREVIDEWS